MVALEQAFKGSIMAGKFPSCVLHLSVPWEAVDVNVHPSKIEVRFLNEKPIFDAVYHGVKSALLSGDQRKEMILPRPKLDPPASQPEQIRLAAKPAIGLSYQIETADLHATEWDFKDVYQESDGGKWVRYDENGHMIKGENCQNGNWYYFEPVTGAMIHGPWTLPDGRKVYMTGTAILAACEIGRASCRERV